MHVNVLHLRVVYSPRPEAVERCKSDCPKSASAIASRSAMSASNSGGSVRAKKGGGMH